MKEYTIENGTAMENVFGVEAQPGVRTMYLWLDGSLSDIINISQEYLDELLHADTIINNYKTRVRELEAETKELRKVISDIRQYNTVSTSLVVAKTPENGHDLLGRRGKILVLGATALDVKTMTGIAKEYGFQKKDFEFETDYDKVVSFAGRSSNFSKYSAIILGACPHKVQNLGDWSNLIEKCKDTSIYPVAVDARNKAGNLKVTKDSFRRALLEVCEGLKNRCEC